MGKTLTIRSALEFVKANPECNINDLLAAFEMPLDSALEDVEYLDREFTGWAIMNFLAEHDYVTFEVTSFDGWKYTATTKEWA